MHRALVGGYMSERAEKMLREAREELVRADSKASILLAGAGVGVGALLAALLAGSWSPSSLIGFAQLLWWMGILMIFGAVFLLGRAVYPRTLSPSRTTTGHVAYYADVIRVGRDGLAEAVEKQQPGEALWDQLFNVSEIVVKKYSDIRWAMAAFGAGTILELAAIAANAMLA